MFVDVSEAIGTRFSESTLGRSAAERHLDGASFEYDLPIIPESEKSEPIQNKIDGLRREAEVDNELRELYPEVEGNTVLSEVYLRDENGIVVKDPTTDESRRIDFAVVDKNGSIVDCVEVTSKTVDKAEQSAKEQRIREGGGNYIKLDDGTLIKIPNDVQTRIERRA